MEAFTTHRGIVATLDRANVDTDQIIAKQFLKSIKKTGFGESLFYDWRFDESGAPREDFELNQARFENASILVARNNFGCGSSREHAVWAVVQYGFRALIAPWREAEDGSRIPGFADIFAGNAVKNGLLTIQLSEAEVDDIFDKVTRCEGLEATIDLEQQRLVLHLDEAVTYDFEINPTVKSQLIRGLDEIAMSLEHETEIATFEAGHDTQLPA